MAREVGQTLSLKVVVEWGDITLASGDVYAVGHYHGVLPTAAEAALDNVISDPLAHERARAWAAGEELDAPEVSEERMVLRQQTRLGLLDGRLGSTVFYPWAEADSSRLVAVCGMGHPGAFEERELRILYRNLGWSIGLLPHVGTLATVLIGTAQGGLSVSTGVTCLLQGLSEALSRLRDPRPSLREVRIVEYDRARALRIAEALRRLQELPPGESPLGETAVSLEITPEPVAGGGGRIFDEYRMALLVAGAARASESDESLHRETVDRLLELVGPELGSEREREVTRQTLRKIYSGLGQDVPRVAGALMSYLARDEGRRGDHPARISFVSELFHFHVPSGAGGDGTGEGTGELGGGAAARRMVRVAAITETATVPERDVRVDTKLIDEVAASMTDPQGEEVERLGRFLNRLVVPREFRPVLLGSSPLIFEVDRHLAAVGWEMLASSHDGVAFKPLGLERPVARQLRTGYSSAPSLEARRDGPPRVLIVGDPGDPARGHDLPGALAEARRIHELFEGWGLEVEMLVGAPNARLPAPLARHRRATRANVLEALLNKDFDLVHYAGHGDFHPQDPSEVGWLFSDGLLTAHEIERLDRVPSLIVANACLSARTSEVAADGAEVRRSRGETRLLPSLADEFFRRGARNYIGTAWEVEDAGAVDFAVHLYSAFFERGLDLGRAMLDARRALHRQRDTYRALWAAYQHYGDPGFRRRDLDGGRGGSEG